MRHRPYDEVIAERLRDDPEYALNLLDAVLEDGEQGESFVLIRQFAKAFPELQPVAKSGGIDVSTAYGDVSATNFPTLEKLRTVIRTMRKLLPASPMRAA